MDKENKKMDSVLFEDVSIKGLQLKNRFVRSATVERMVTKGGCPSQDLMDLYCRLSEGGVGFMITGGVPLEVSNGFSGTMGINEDHQIEAWRNVVDAVHKRGTKMAMQLTHLGRQGVLMQQPAIAPSAVPIAGSDIVPREMTPRGIKDLVEKYAQTCLHVKEAGFDAVQFHCAHGNLPNNFFSPFTNLRTDAYGGCTENRSRFVVEFVKRTRELTGPNFIIAVKMNFDDFVEGGLCKEEAIDIAKIIVQAGVDCIEVSGGTLSESPDRIAVAGINSEEKEAYFQSYARALKESVSIPVMLVGGFRSPHLMEKLVNNGTTDFISMCRPLIREPQLISRWKSGDMARAKCISCNICFKNCFDHPLRCYIEDPLEKNQQGSSGIWAKPLIERL